MELDEFYRDENGFWRLRKAARRRKYALVRRPIPFRQHANLGASN